MYRKFAILGVKSLCKNGEEKPGVGYSKLILTGILLDGLKFSFTGIWEFCFQLRLQPAAQTACTVNLI